MALVLQEAYRDTSSPSERATCCCSRVFSAAVNGTRSMISLFEFALQLDNNEFLSVALNNVLEHELAWHRHVSQPFVHVTDSEEIETIENLFVFGPFAGAAPHLMSVIDHLGRQQALEC